MKTASSIDAHIRTFPKEIQILLEKIRETIHRAAPKAEETIRYGIPTFRLNGKNVVHFAGYAHHIGFYPGAEAIIAFKKELVSFVTSKGTVQFSLDKPIPYALITKIVKYRVKEILQRTK